MRPRRTTVITKNPVRTGVRRKNPYSGILASRKTATPMHIHTICLSKKKFSTENDRIVTSPAIEIASAEATRNQSIWTNTCLPVGRVRMRASAARFRANIRLLGPRPQNSGGNDRDDINLPHRRGKRIGPTEVYGDVGTRCNA